MGRYECAVCYQQTSATSGTVFHATKVPLTKWFWAIYWLARDKGGISALRLSKLIGITWRNAYRKLEKLRKAMRHRVSLYRLSNVFELDDAYIGGKKTGKRGRGADGKVSVLIACENIDDKPGFIAMEVVYSLTKKATGDFARRRIQVAQMVRIDALPANSSLQFHVNYIPKVAQPEMASEWLSWVHVVIANLKRFLMGTFHGTSNRYVQDYLNEFPIDSTADSGKQRSPIDS